jgi:hypothetical protein
MVSLPSPPVPADADLTHYDDMPLEVRRLRDSGIAGVADAEVFRCAVLLWCTAWHQVPAGSLPQADADLCRLVGLGRDVRTWAKIKTGVLRGWRPFSDGRLYHPVVTEKVIAGWNSTRITRWAKECDRLRKENKARDQRKEQHLPLPEKPAAIPYVWPSEVAANSVGIPPENGLNRIERNGMDVLKGPPTGVPSEEHQPTSPPVSAREGHEGPARDDGVVSLIDRVAAARTVMA